MFCDLIEILLRIEFRTKGRHWLSRPQNEALLWKQRLNGLQTKAKKVALMKEPIFRSDCISTIYPKSRFCTKRHKRRCFQSFSGFFESYSRNAEKENCKFEPRKCSFVLRSCIHKQFCSLGRGFFFDYSEGDIGGWKYQMLFIARINKSISYESNTEIISL